MILQLNGVNAFYGASQILFGVNVEVEEADSVCVLGRNGVGKSTMMKSIVGNLNPKEKSLVTGSIRYCGDELVADSFQYERRFTMGLKRFRSAIESATPLRFKCSPFTPEQDIYMEAPRENGRPWIKLIRATPLTIINVPLN